MSSWIIPFLITIFFFIKAKMNINQASVRELYGNVLETIFYNGLALILSLIVWLIYFAIT